MSEIAGLASINLAYTEQAATDGKTVQHSLLVAEDTPQSSGRVAIISGTVGTAQLQVALAPTTYLNADGDYVTFSGTAPRLALQSSSSSLVKVEDQDIGVVRLCSSNGHVSVTDWNPSSYIDSGLFVSSESGTADYTILLWAD